MHFRKHSGPSRPLQCHWDLQGAQNCVRCGCRPAPPQPPPHPGPQASGCVLLGRSPPPSRAAPMASLQVPLCPLLERCPGLGLPRVRKGPPSCVLATCTGSADAQPVLSGFKSSCHRSRVTWDNFLTFLSLGSCLCQVGIVTIRAHRKALRSHMEGTWHSARPINKQHVSHNQDHQFPKSSPHRPLRCENSKRASHSREVSPAGGKCFRKASWWQMPAKKPAQRQKNPLAPRHRKG